MTATAKSAYPRARTDKVEPRHRKDGTATRRRIFDHAIRLFRTKGFDETTMRDIARAAKLSLGAAYHYYPSKQAIVLGYYEEAQERHEMLVRERLPSVTDLRSRLGVVFHSKLDAVQGDRGVMTSIVRVLVDPRDPMSAFSEETRRFRERSAALWRDVLASTDLPAEHRETMVWALWALMMGVLLYLIHDDSEGEARTRRLVDDLLDLVPGLVPLISSPLLGPAMEQVRSMLERAGLMPGPSNL